MLRFRQEIPPGRRSRRPGASRWHQCAAPSTTAVPPVRHRRGDRLGEGGGCHRVELAAGREGRTRDSIEVDHPCRPPSPPTNRRRRAGRSRRSARGTGPASAGSESRRASLSPVWATVVAISSMRPARASSTRSSNTGADSGRQRSAPPIITRPLTRSPRRTEACSAIMQPTEWPTRIARPTSRRSSIRSTSSDPQPDRVGAGRLRAATGAALVVRDRPKAAGLAGGELRPPGVRGAAEPVDEHDRGRLCRRPLAAPRRRGRVLELERGSPCPQPTATPCR